jgi:hypothetical protein
VAHQFERRQVVLRLGQQVYDQKPARQRQFGGGENSFAVDAALVTTTLVERISGSGQANLAAELPLSRPI